MFAIDEILRYRGTRFPHFITPWMTVPRKGQEWSWMRVNEKHADVHFNYPNKRHCMYIEVLQSCSISIKHMEAASSLQSWAFWASSDVQLLQVATGLKCKIYLCNTAQIVLLCNSVQLFAMQCSFVQLLQEKDDCAQDFTIFFQFLMYFDLLFLMHSTWTSHVQLLVTKACWLKNGHELFLKLGWKMPQNHNCHFSFT